MSPSVPSPHMWASSGVDDDLGRTLEDLPRWMGRTFQVWENVKAYGARGNGSTDDTVAIQEAIDACPNGGTVYFPGGRYNISDTLNVGIHGGAYQRGIKLLGAGGAIGQDFGQTGTTWLMWSGADGAGPMMLWQNVFGATMQGINFWGDQKAQTLLRITHGTGDSNPHSMLVESCNFRASKTYGVVVGSTTNADEADADVCTLAFMRCRFAHGGSAGPNIRAHFRGTSANALPISFYNCEWEGDSSDAAAGCDYHLELTGGMYNLFGGLSSGAQVSTILYNLNPIAGLEQVPPAVNIYGFESQGDYSFIRFDVASRSSAAAQRATTLTGVYIGGDGSPYHADAIQWDEQGWAPLVLNGVRMVANVNIVNPSAFVFVNGLLLQDGGGSITGHTECVSGHWYDGTPGGSPKWFAQTPGPFKVKADVTANRDAASIAGEGAMWYDKTLLKPIWSDGTNWRDAAGTVV